MRIVIQPTGYSFNAAAKTVTFNNYATIKEEDVFLITNLQNNIIIYNFAKTGKGGSVSGNVLTLEYDTTLMNDNDKLQIIYEDTTVGTLGTVTLTNPSTNYSLETGNLADIKTQQTDKSQFTKLTDGVDTALITAAGEQNVIATPQPGVDIGDVTINNGAGVAAVNIQDGGNSITVDGTITVSNPSAPLTNYSLETTQQDVLSALNNLKTYTDGIESLLTAINSDTTTENTNLASVIAALNDIKTYTDGLEGYTDGLEGLVASSNTLLTTLNTYVDGVESKLDILNAKDFATQTTLSAAKIVLDDIYTKLQASIAVTGTFWQATQPVSNPNLDVALSTRTKPSDQQHVIIDSGAQTNGLTDAQLRATVVPVDVTPVTPLANDYLPIRLTDGTAFYTAGGATDPLIAYKIADEDSSLSPKYYGFTSATNANKWYILRITGAASPFSYKYANISNNPTRTDYGNAGASGAWANRASLTFDYLYLLTNL